MEARRMIFDFIHVKTGLWRCHLGRGSTYWTELANAVWEHDAVTRCSVTVLDALKYDLTGHC